MSGAGGTGPGSEAGAIWFPGDLLPSGAETLGGKGEGLRKLISRGLPVPPFFCVTTRVLAGILRRGGEGLAADLALLSRLDRVDEGPDDRLRALSERLRSGIRDSGLPTGVAEELREAVDRAFGADARVAVRSSVVGEDSAGDSFAGQMDTFLHVARRDVADRVLECLASAFSERALRYRQARNLLERPIEAGVVIQEMASARTSGVVFTANPTTGDASEIVVSAAPGLGEGVVAGLVEADTFHLDRGTRSLRRREVVEKAHRVAPDPDAPGGTRVEEVAEPLRHAPALSDAELDEVVALALRVEGNEGKPLDLEWTIETDGTLRLLQARPITWPSFGRLTVLDNANIVEGYPGISSPLTFSFVRGAYEGSFREALRMFGVSSRTLERERTLFENLVAYVDGRIYYNILHWYGLYSLLGLERAVPAWERALGLERRIRDVAGLEGPGAARRAFIRFRIVVNHFSRNRRAAAYQRLLETMRSRVDAVVSGTVDGHRLLEMVEEVKDHLVAPYGVAVVNDFYGQQFYAVLGSLIERWDLGDPEELRSGLLAGDAELESLRPLHSLVALSETIRETGAWRELFESDLTLPALHEALYRRPHLRELRDRFDEHLERYGDRTLQELKLETPSLRDDPTFALSLLRGYVRTGGGADRKDTEGVRREAEAAVRARLRMRPLRRALFFRLVGYTREALRHRESLRLARTRAFGLVKRLYGALATRFVAAGMLDDPGDIFFLTEEEVAGAIRSHGTTRDLRALVALRRDELRRFEATQPPPRIVTWGPVRSTWSPPDAPSGEEGEGRLEGAGCGGGIVRGHAFVVTEAGRDVIPRDGILVAPMTDPGWVFLMAAARGLVVERGSILSHTAIIGRELGIPTVVGVRQATRRIRTGDLIEVDGFTGVVTVLEAAPDPPSAPTHASAEET